MKKVSKGLIVLVILFTSFIFTNCTAESIDEETNEQLQSVDPETVKPPTGG